MATLFASDLPTDITMFTDQMSSVLTGLAFIIPAILILRWLLRGKIGSPDEIVEHHIQELKRRYERGDIDEETYQKQLHDMTEG